MRWFSFAVIYTCLGLAANTAAAADTGALEAMREGDMRKLVFSEPAPVPETAFDSEDGSRISLADYRGRYVLVNFWATWCAPCREEMPSLSQLQEELGGEDFEVVTIATGRNPEAGMKRFFDEVGVDNLPLHRDPTQALARQMAVLALPISVILDPEGREIARLRGDADWASPEAIALLRALLKDPDNT
jgi:thiol-disulfide isomerase/thioredoxin